MTGFWEEEHQKVQEVLLIHEKCKLFLSELALIRTTRHGHRLFPVQVRRGRWQKGNDSCPQERLIVRNLWLMATLSDLWTKVFWILSILNDFIWCWIRRQKLGLLFGVDFFFFLFASKVFRKSERWCISNSFNIHA